MPEWDFSGSPVAYEFKNSRAPLAGCLGPVGSGKSVPLILRIGDIAGEQAASPDGVRRSRYAVVRNTYPELKSTTAQTFDNIYPESAFGSIKWASPPGIKLRWPGIEAEVNFVALDKPQDVKKLLSLELTAALVNEAREVPRTVINRLSERVGRYRINERPTTWRGVWLDSNPPDVGHWLHNWHMKDTPEGFKFWSQPPGVLEVERAKGDAVIITDENFPRWNGLRLDHADVLCTYRGSVQVVRCPVEVIAAAGREWIVNPWAENHIALSKVAPGRNPIGRLSYYGQALAGKLLEEIRSYLQGVYTFVADGKRVVPEYDDEAHSRESLPVLEDVPIQGGMDIGGGTLQPAAVWFQQHPRGPYLIHGETIGSDMGLERFGEECTAYLSRRFPSHVGRGMVGPIYGDPAGASRDEIFETAGFDYLSSKHGLAVQPAPTQDIKLRTRAISAPCARMIDGKPGLLLNRTECPTLRRGLQGAWHFRRVQVAGESRFMDKPSKNDESHPCDALGYGLMGAGELVELHGPGLEDQTSEADVDFDVFD